MLVRSVLTRSDLGGALIEGADFSDAVLDLLQKQALHIAHVQLEHIFFKIRTLSFSFLQQ